MKRCCATCKQLIQEDGGYCPILTARVDTHKDDAWEIAKKFSCSEWEGVPA